MMFTPCELAICICCTQDDSSDDERVTPDSTRPLLDHSPSSTPKMPRARTYGRRKQTATAAASAIFGSASSPQQQSPSSPARAPLRDLTTLLSNLDIRAKEDGRGEEFEPSSSNAKNKHPRRTHLSEKQQEKGQIINNDKSSDSSPSESSQDSDDISVPFRSGNYTPDTLALLPLLKKYKADTQRRLPVEKWDDVLPAGSQVVKIAEASYAEVYRVSIDGSESILKVMQLKIPSDEASLQCYTAIEISQVVSEVRVMNALTEYPGFVTFKAAHLIRGKPCASLIRARNDCERWDPKAGLSNFPNPSTFTGNSIFLAIELGDAGQVLEEVDIVNSDQLWDIFLGVVVALAAAEEMFNFEHRDLHENNICISRNQPRAIDPSQNYSKYGRSGFEVTILDYGLSRATLPSGDIVYNDLENDLGVFQGAPGHAQFDIYRRMRTHLFLGDRSMFPRGWHDEGSKGKNNGHSWSEFTPYSNVLWLKYILGYLRKAFRDCGGDDGELAKFTIETRELTRRFNPRTLVDNRAFSTAREVFDYVVAEGFLAPEQVANMTEGTSMLSEANGADQGEVEVEDEEYECLV